MRTLSPTCFTPLILVIMLLWPAPSQASEPDKREQKGFATFNAATSRGVALWNDTTLGTSGFSCLSGGCHADFANLNFDKNQNYPHFVAMTGKVVTLTQIINYCLSNPMAGKPLPADSESMTALAAYYRSYRIRYRTEAATQGQREGAEQ